MTAERLPAGVRVFERGWLSSNNVLVVGSESTTLIDSGYVTHAGLTLALVGEQLGSRPLDVLLNTHLHSDHCGGNASLQSRYPDLSTRIPPGDAPAVDLWDTEALSFMATGQQCDRFRYDGLVQAGDELDLGNGMWEAHAAPGHDPHSIVLFEPVTATLISADALWQSGFGVVFPELSGEPSFEQVSATLDLIDCLAPRIVIPGHGPMFDDVSSALTAARRRLDAFSKDPTKHARHALKVLVKFKLLELQQVRMDALKRWAESTPYFETIRQRFFDDCTIDQLVDGIFSQLVASRAAEVVEGRIIDR